MLYPGGSLSRGRQTANRPASARDMHYPRFLTAGTQGPQPDVLSPSRPPRREALCTGTQPLR